MNQTSSQFAGNMCDYFILERDFTAFKNWLLEGEKQDVVV